jgi:putative peptidoglycan lipid II flippase
MIIFAFSICVKTISTAKELVVAFKFGVSDQLDAFLIAYIIPSFIITLIAGSLNSAFIPTYIQVREQDGEEAAGKLFLNIQTFTAVILLLVIFILYLLNPYIVSFMFPGLDIQTSRLAEHLFVILLPITFVSGIETLWGAVLNARERFIFVSMLPLMTPVVTIIGLLISPKTGGVTVYAISFLIGAILETFILGILLVCKRVLMFTRKLEWSPWVKQVFRQYLPMLAGTLLMSSTTLIDQTMASGLGSGSVSILNYSSKLVSVLVGVLSMAIGTAVLPYFSKMVANKEWDVMLHTYKQWIWVLLAISIPVTVCLIIFSRPLVGLLFERGAFSLEDVPKVSMTQIFLLLQMPFYMLGILAVRIIEALKGTSIFILGNAINALVNIVFNWVLMRFMGVQGIALSTSIVYLVSFIYLSICLRRLMRRTIHV